MKFTQEQEEIYQMLIEEAERDIEKNGVMTEEEFWSKFNKLERRCEKYQNLIENRKNIKLSTIKCFGKISKKYIRA